MTSSTNPTINQPAVMIEESADVAYVSDVPLLVERDAKGLPLVKVDFTIAAARVPMKSNSAEATKTSCPDEVKVTSTEAGAAVLASLVRTNQKINGKYFIYTQRAKELLDILNASDSSLTDEWTQKNSIFFADLSKEQKAEKSYLEKEYDLVLVDSKDKRLCQQVSSFQVTTLPSFRQLHDQVTIDKTKTRYEEAQFTWRAASSDIFIYALKDKKTQEIRGTFTLNMHRGTDLEGSDRWGYLSDLFIPADKVGDGKFVTQFIADVFADIHQKFPQIKTLIVMAATNDPTKPILRCFNYAKNVGLLELYTRKKQEELGIVIQMSYKPEHIGKMHLSKISPSYRKSLSFLAEMDRRELSAKVDVSATETPRLGVKLSRDN